MLKLDERLIRLLKGVTRGVIGMSFIMTFDFRSVVAGYTSKLYWT